MFAILGDTVLSAKSELDFPDAPRRPAEILGRNREFHLFQAPQITLSAPQRQIFEELKKGTHVPQHLAQRATLILLAAEGEKNLRIAQTTGLARNTVKAWRQRWAARASRLNQIEANQPRALRAAIGVALEDAPRSGHPGKTTNIQLALILQMACESPEKYDVPLSHWTAAALARTAIQRGFVERISARQVGRYLAQADLKPHWSRYGLNPDVDDPEAFEANVRKICDSIRTHRNWPRRGSKCIPSTR